MEFLDEQIKAHLAVGRNMKPEAMIEILENKAKDICAEFADFTDGYRVIQLILRKSDGGGTNNDKVRKYISTNPQEFYENILKCLKYDFCSEKKFRIYSTVNVRNVDKAIREFKTLQLNADYDPNHIRNDFYNDTRNRWISALMKPSCKATSFFLIDVDHDSPSEAGEKLQALGIATHKVYRTKNGWHFITDPFDPSLMAGLKDTGVQKDSLLLLHF